MDSERYSFLVKSVMSSRISSQTPETLQAEDEHVYGPVVKAQTSARPETRVPKILHPFLNCQGTLETEEPESEPPARIVLNRGQGRSLVPSVTRILQATLSPDQIFYLERWKKKMIAELGEEGFKEHSQSKTCKFRCIELSWMWWDKIVTVLLCSQQICLDKGSVSIQLWRMFLCHMHHVRPKVLQSIHLRCRDTCRASLTSWRTSVQ